MKRNKLLNLLLSLLISFNSLSCSNKDKENISNNDITSNVDNNSNDKENNSSEEEIETTSYDYEEIIKTPTCTEPGEKLVKYGEKEKTITLAPLGHNFSSGHVIKNPTETEKGIKEYKCSNPNCNEVITEEFELKDSFKTFTEKIITAPTCTEDGLKEYKLLNNGVEEVIQEVLPALGHNFIKNSNNKYAIVTHPSNTDGGQCKYTCSRCNALSENTYTMTNRDFFYTEGLKKLCDYDMEIYPYIQKLYRDIETGLENEINRLINEKIVVCTGGTIRGISYTIERNYNEIPNIPKYDKIEDTLALLVRHSNPKYWYLTCAREGIETYKRSTRSTHVSTDTQANTSIKRISYTLSSWVDGLLSSKDSVVKQVDSVVSSLINPEMNDLEKVLAIYNYIAKNYTYKKDGITGYGTFIYMFEKKSGVCSNYASLFHYMATKANVLCTTRTDEIPSDIDDHAWNWVYLNNKWYELDVTNGGTKYMDRYFLTKIDDSDDYDNIWISKFIEKRKIGEKVGRNYLRVYKNGKSLGLFPTLEDALYIINDSKAKFVIALNEARTTNTYTLSTFQRGVNCSSLEIIDTNKSAKITIQAPKEFFDNNNITVQDNITVKYI